MGDLAVNWNKESKARKDLQETFCWSDFDWFWWWNGIDLQWMQHTSCKLDMEKRISKKHERERQREREVEEPVVSLHQDGRSSTPCSSRRWHGPWWRCGAPAVPHPLFPATNRQGRGEPRQPHLVVHSELQKFVRYDLSDDVSGAETVAVVAGDSAELVLGQRSTPAVLGMRAYTGGHRGEAAGGGASHMVAGVGRRPSTRRWARRTRLVARRP